MPMLGELLLHSVLFGQLSLSTRATGVPVCRRYCCCKPFIALLLSIPLLLLLGRLRLRAIERLLVLVEFPEQLEAITIVLTVS